jgi:hypothetical protein
MTEPRQSPTDLSSLPDQFVSIFGEPLEQTLDLSTWSESTRLGDLYGQLQQEVAAAQHHSLAARQAIRDQVYPRIRKQRTAPKGAGVYQANHKEIEAVQRGLLFTGAVEACHGIAVTHESLSLTITQIGICLVSYQADLGSWVHRLYRRDLREAVDDPVELAQQLLARRRRDEGGDLALGPQSSRLARRSVLAYAERATLLERSTAPWRVCQGNPMPVELLAGSGSQELVEKSIAMLEQLTLDHKMVLFVPSTLNQLDVATIADSLKPLEYAIVADMSRSLTAVIESHHYAASLGRKLMKFVERVGPQMVVGCFRTSTIGPARLFYAHVDHAHEAAQIAIADSALQAHRNMPVLLDLAGELCRSSFGQTDFVATLQNAYAAAGLPYSFHQEFGSA